MYTYTNRQERTHQFTHTGPRTRTPTHACTQGIHLHIHTRPYPSCAVFKYDEAPVCQHGQSHPFQFRHEWYAVCRPELDQKAWPPWHYCRVLASVSPLDHLLYSLILLSFGGLMLLFFLLAVHAFHKLTRPRQVSSRRDGIRFCEPHRGTSSWSTARKTLCAARTIKRATTRVVVLPARTCCAANIRVQRTAMMMAACRLSSRTSRTCMGIRRREVVSEALTMCHCVDPSVLIPTEHFTTSAFHPSQRSLPYGAPHSCNP